MESVVYILYSEKLDIHNTGYTSNLISLLKSHNEKSSKGFTRKYRPWSVIYVSFFTTKSEAIKYERFIKSGQGRAFVKTIPK